MYRRDHSTGGSNRRPRRRHVVLLAGCGRTNAAAAASAPAALAAAGAAAAALAAAAAAAVAVAVDAATATESDSNGLGTLDGALLLDTIYTSTKMYSHLVSTHPSMILLL